MDVLHYGCLHLFLLISSLNSCTISLQPNETLNQCQQCKIMMLLKTANKNEYD